MIYTVSSELYNEVLRRLCEAAGAAGYFSGSVEFDFEDLTCNLLTSVIVRHRSESMPEGEFDIIDDMIPVWWEFHTIADNGEVLNDFSFDELREYLRSC